MNELKLTKSELTKREDVIKSMLSQRRDLVKLYGKDAEKVMYGRATNIAKKQTQDQLDKMDVDLKEIIKSVLKTPQKKK